MKNRMIFFIIVLFCKVYAMKANTEPTVTDSIISVRIEQNKDTQSNYRYSANLFIFNPQSDTLDIRSSFRIDWAQGLSYILIYSCQKLNDSTVCNYDWPRYYGEGESPTEPLIVEYFNRKLSIAPKDTISMIIPIRGDYEGSEIFFDIQIAVIQGEKAYFFRTKTNKIVLNKNGMK